MSKKKTKKRSAPRGSGYNSLLIIIVSSILIAIPLFILGRVVYESYMEAGEPIMGERYDNLPNKISADQVNSVQEAVSTMPNIEKASANLQSGTLKIQIDVRDDMTLEELGALQVEVYNKVASLLPIETYFTRTDTVKNYDLEMSFYNNPETFELHSIYVKNATMSEPKVNVVSTPLNPALIEVPIPESFDYNALLNEALHLNDQLLVDVTVEQIELMISKVRTASEHESEVKEQLTNILSELEAKLGRKKAQ